jgi:2-polyprenyl-3-methyl-5-hydroxy-6-metoxy-1,4-benzoquinol methylase
MKKATRTSLACWCGGTLESTRVRTETFSLLRCPVCGSFKIDPPPISGEEQSGDFYTAYYATRNIAGSDTTGGSGRRSRYWRVVRQVPALSTPSRTVIDFGSGEGGLCHELAQAGWEDVFGVDVSRARVARARRSFPSIRFYDRPLPQTDIRPGSADLCVMDNVIEHLTEPRTVLEELRRYIKPGGKIVVITPNMESGTFRLLGKRWTPELAPHAHIFLFTPGSLARVVTDGGFAVQTVGTFHEDPYSVRRWTRRLFSGDVKGAIWRAHQELGAVYSRIVGAGPMVYVVAEVPAECETGTGQRIPVPSKAEAVSQGGAR